MNLSSLIHNYSLSTISTLHIWDWQQRSLVSDLGAVKVRKFIQIVAAGNCFDPGVLQRAVLCLKAGSHAWKSIEHWQLLKSFACVLQVRDHLCSMPTDKDGTYCLYTAFITFTFLHVSWTLMERDYKHSSTEGNRGASVEQSRPKFKPEQV